MDGNTEPMVDIHVFEYCLACYNAFFFCFRQKKATLLFGPFKVCQKNSVFAVFAILQNLSLVKIFGHCIGVDEMSGDISAREKLRSHCKSPT